MKKNALLGLTVLVSLCLMLFACRKDIRNYIENKTEGSSVQLESAKIWRLQNLAYGENLKNTSILKPIWSDSWTIRSSKGHQLLIVPAPEHYVRNKDLSIRRFFVFRTEHDETVSGQIVELLGRKFNVEENLDNLLANYEETKITNFNGSVYVYDINYQKVRSATYLKGQKTESFSSIVSARADNKSFSVARPSSTNGLCATVYPIKNGWPLIPCDNAQVISIADYTYDSYGCILRITLTYVNHTCPGQSTSPGTSSGSASSSSGTTSPEYGGGGSTINVDVSNICIAYQVTHALEANNAIKDMLEQEFLFSGLDRTLNISDVNNLADTVMGNTNGYNNTINITLNENKLPGRSNEYILATVYHEILHGYMDLKLTKDSQGRFIVPNDHNTMATSYVATMTGALQTAFPSLSTNEAWALAWGGLENTTLFNSNLLTDTQRADIKAINSRHSKTPPSGTTAMGTFCNYNF
ncbi:hypothetical protein ACFOG5_06025 [Pedobacter fastidiosus]|uniref:SprT-like family protein n=1 Tax=Pedobacter fastidiosus TaxID=2765361 RepID=A0ABR7KQR3_9SPHI|nr:hypothetical protein [Pedobacter fastidiosus]MBC6110304.1 hypothetical protein [Pedobacter fastidiosus]